MANPRNLADIAPLVSASGNKLALTNTALLSGGTANGVLYLNGSKEATSGTGLVFDGNNLLVGNTTPFYNTTGRGLVNINGSSQSLLGLGTGGTGRAYFSANSTLATIEAESGLDLKLNAIGSKTIQFWTSNTFRGQFNSAGNFLLGPSNTTASNDLGSHSLQIPSGSKIASGGFGRIWVPGQQIGSTTYAGLYGLASTYNAYYSNGWKSLGGGTASAITLDEGVFSFSSNNGTNGPDETVTWITRFYANSSGIVVNGHYNFSSGNTLAQINNYNSQDLELVNRVSNTGINFYVSSGAYAGRFDSSGRLLVGLTSPNTIGISGIGVWAPAFSVGAQLSGGDTMYLRREGTNSYTFQTHTGSQNAGNIFLQPFGGGVGINTNSNIPSDLSLKVAGRIGTSGLFNNGSYKAINFSTTWATIFTIDASSDKIVWFALKCMNQENGGMSHVSIYGYAVIRHNGSAFSDFYSMGAVWDANMQTAASSTHTEIQFVPIAGQNSNLVLQVRNNIYSNGMYIYEANILAGEVSWNI